MVVRLSLLVVISFLLMEVLFYLLVVCILRAVCMREILTKQQWWSRLCLILNLHIWTLVEPARLVTLTDIDSKLPAGRNNPMIGSIMSFTMAVTSLEAAWPITKSIARPIIPNVFRKSKNPWAKVLLTSGSSSALFNCWPL